MIQNAAGRTKTNTDVNASGICSERNIRDHKPWKGAKSHLRVEFGKVGRRHQKPRKSQSRIWRLELPTPLRVTGLYRQLVGAKWLWVQEMEYLGVRTSYMLSEKDFSSPMLRFET